MTRRKREYKQNFYNRHYFNMGQNRYGYAESIPLMPESYKGAYLKSCGYTKTTPREWTSKEIEYLMMLHEEGRSRKYIAVSMGRSETSIALKLKRQGKVSKEYNKDHVADKYAANEEFFAEINPKTVLDLYAGHSWWKEKMCSPFVFTNDKNEKYDTDTHKPAEMLVHDLYYRKFKFDVIDLDPFGTAYDCFECAIRMARKGLVITYGEMGHKRWKRLDFVRTHYGIESLDEFTTQRLIEETQKIAARYHRELTPVIVKEWKNISRVYYLISPIKVTEQWKRS